MQRNSAPNVPTGRIAIIDVARGAALVAMTVYHFAWDLESFGWLLPGTMRETGWIVFARSIAASFLGLVGVSLVLAHNENIRWKSFGKRLTQIAAASLVITVATYFAIPDNYIFFGILHAIAAFSVLGLLFIRLPWWVSFIAAGLVWVVAQNYTAEFFAHPSLVWIGLAPTPPNSNDFVPLFPWMAAVLTGIALAKLATDFNLWTSLKGIQIQALVSQPLTFIGRHSLIYYLVHQPLMIGLLWLFTTFITQPDQTRAFAINCNAQCQVIQTKEFCESYCTCAADQLKTKELFTPYSTGKLTAFQQAVISEIQDMCISE